MNKYYPEIKKNFGFGCMRLPMIGEEVDYEEMNKMVDAFLESGFNYFDTAHGYLNGKSELALKKCLTSRYPREAYILTNKLSGFHFNTQEEIRPLFESLLEACGVTYFDFYLMHAQNAALFEKYKACKAYETAFELKEEGKIKHVGISFHDTADVLDQILTEYPQLEVVQIQLNYVDFENPKVQSRQCLEVCRKHGKPAIIMEPVKGGSLVNLPEDAQKIFDALESGSNASYAIRFAASQEGVMMVLSGMGSMEMMTDNVSYMKDFVPLNEAEYQAIDKVVEVFQNIECIPCTACKYCTEVCPQGVKIPDIFDVYNDYKKYNNESSAFVYNNFVCGKGGKASECVKCGACEAACPQKLPIRDLLDEVVEAFEK